jgi:hypothetical protein
MLRPILLAGFVAIFPTMVQAQGRVMMPAASHPMSVAPRMMAHAGQPAAVQAIPMARIAPRAGGPHQRATGARAPSTRRTVGTRRHSAAEETELPSDFIPVPGLGFDMAHLAATRGAGAVGARRHKGSVPLFFPLLEGGFFLPGALEVAEGNAAAEPQQAEEADAEVAETTRRARGYRPAQTAEVEAASVAPRQTEEYVFVRRDGTVFFAVAYAWENGTLRYITSEGLRRSLTRDALDLDATQQFNEQRGMNFRLPA